MTFHPVMTIQEVLDVTPEIGGAPLPVRVTGSR
jgi:hypothetical protein